MTIRGNKKIICLVSERMIPLVALPMDVKKLEEIGWIQSKKVKNK